MYQHVFLYPWKTTYIPGREPGWQALSDLADSSKTQQHPEPEAQCRPTAFDSSSSFQHGIQGPPTVDSKRRHAGVEGGVRSKHEQVLGECLAGSSEWDILS